MPAPQDTRTAILEAARRILFDEGWEALTHQHVAEVAGVGRATVYRHWPQPISLLQDACAAEILTIHTEPTGDLRHDLVAALEAMRREMVDRRAGRVLIALADRSPWEPDIRAVKRRFVRDGLSGLRRILQTAMRDGQLPGDLDLDWAVAALVGPMVYRYLILEQPISKAAVAGNVDDFLGRHQKH